MPILIGPSSETPSGDRIVASKLKTFQGFGLARASEILSYPRLNPEPITSSSESIRFSVNPINFLNFLNPDIRMRHPNP